MLWVRGKFARDMYSIMDTLDTEGVLEEYWCADDIKQMLKAGMKIVGAELRGEECFITPLNTLETFIMNYYRREVALGKLPTTAKEGFAYYVSKCEVTGNETIAVTPTIRLRDADYANADVVIDYSTLPEELPDWCEMVKPDYKNMHRTFPIVSGLDKKFIEPSSLGKGINKGIKTSVVYTTGWDESDGVIIPDGTKSVASLATHSDSVFQETLVPLYMHIPDSVVKMYDIAENIEFLPNSKIFPKSLRVLDSLDTDMFYRCDFSNIPEEVLPEGLEIIRGEIFTRCRGMQSILTHLPSTLKEIGTLVFSSADANFPDDDSDIIDCIQIPEKCEIVGECAFSNVQCLHYVINNSKCVRLGENAFSKLTQEFYPTKVTFKRGTLVLLGNSGYDLSTEDKRNRLLVENQNGEGLRAFLGVSEIEIVG